MRLCFSDPERLTAFFSVPPDLTFWNGQYSDGTSGIRTPHRGRATFQTIGRSLESRGRPALPHAHGLYVLAFRIPYPAIYIGIAADDGRAPEGTARRLRKHRIKATGSHISDRPGAGGVHHPKAWGEFASERFNHLRDLGEGDVLADAMVMTGAIKGGANRKGECLYFEGHLTRHGVLREELVRKLFGTVHEPPFALNAAGSSGCCTGSAGVTFGSGGTVWLQD